jgi:rare lipoprotein A
MGLAARCPAPPLRRIARQKRNDVMRFKLRLIRFRNQTVEISRMTSVHFGRARIRLAPYALAAALALPLVSAITGPAAAFTQTGVASYYGPELHGRRTASGERFNKEALTAAHRTAPFGSRLKVTNLVNGRSVMVRVNDRGPFVRGRIVDVSQGAARQIGMQGRGVARVRIERQ